MSKHKKSQKYARVNKQIKARKVRLIDKDGNQLGVVLIQDALQQAGEAGLDLIEVAPKATPPVCKIMDYGKYKYKQKKRDHASKKSQKRSQLKEVRFSSKIEEHDYQHKLNHIIKFLNKGYKVRILIYFRGREITHKNLGKELMQRIQDNVDGHGKVETTAHMEGKRMLMLLSP